MLHQEGVITLLVVTKVVVIAHDKLFYTEFTDKVTLSFAVKDNLVDSLSEKITEMSGGRDELLEIGKRFDYR